ncbi:MAG: hypothetical protein GY847_35500 [Proteobacteria bacterium]|nr:hypothetical protein [Pseudomonadota bacterium]
MTELSHFEELSTKTPVKQPYAIIVGSALLPLILWALSLLSPSEGVKDLKEAEGAGDTMTQQAADDGEEI